MAGLSFDQRGDRLWMDGALIPWSDARVHVLNHGLHYASSVFEGLRVYDGRIFKLKEHSERLFKSAELMGFSIPYRQEEIEAATLEAVEAEQVSNGYVRPVAWRGSEMMAISAQETRIHVAIAAWEMSRYFGDRAGGIRLDWAEWRRPDPLTAPSHAKAAGLYMICTLSKHAAEAKGYADALMLDWRGQVAEATGANIFFVQDGGLVTPTPDCFLDGITRRTVIDLAAEEGIRVEERAIWPEELAAFSECFLTGTAAELTPVKQIGEDLHFNIGAVTNKLMNAYGDAVYGRR